MPSVLVTGGASGIGEASCELLAARGWTVVAADIAARDGVVRLDVTDEQSWAEVTARLGPFTGLVNCAGIRPRSHLVDMDMQEWNQVLAVNLTGSFLGVRAMLRAWLADGTRGSIVNLASANSFVGTPGNGHYAASKGGVALLTKTAALEVADRGIRVNAVAPGPVLTAMVAERLVEPGQKEWLESRVPMGRLGEPSEIAELIAFLLSDAASFITGSIMSIDGGRLAG